LARPDGIYSFPAIDSLYGLEIVEC
jgi:hypothetical protein